MQYVLLHFYGKGHIVNLYIYVYNFVIFSPYNFDQRPEGFILNFKTSLDGFKN